VVKIRVQKILENLPILQNVIEKSFINWRALPLVKTHIFQIHPVYRYDLLPYYTGCRKINVFQVGGLVGKNLRNLEKIKQKIKGGLYKNIWV
jgi:hypothetical protein